jgi:nucleotide-binding universal stress UspA family protein
MRHDSLFKKSILLATDFSAPARRAYAYALRLSSVLNARLILLHVIKAPAGFQAGARRSLAPLKTKALLELGRMAHHAEEHGVVARHKLLVGVPEEAILKVAEERSPELIAMGTQGRTGWDRLKLGSTAETVLQRAPCPVLTVHASMVADVPAGPRRIKLTRILVAMDFSVCSQAALRSAAMWRHRLKAQMFLVHAFQSPAAAPPSDRNLPKPLREKAERRVQAALGVSSANESIADLIFASGDPVEVILDQAKRLRADLIVLGTHGRRGLQRLVLGSVAESIVRRASCPVLVVKAGVGQRLDTRAAVK